MAAHDDDFNACGQPVCVVVERTLLTLLSMDVPDLLFELLHICEPESEAQDPVPPMLDLHGCSMQHLNPDQHGSFVRHQRLLLQPAVLVYHFAFSLGLARLLP